MKILFKRLHEDAVIPSKTYPNDFCYDVTAVSEEEIAPNVWRYGLGFAMQIVRGMETTMDLYAPVMNYSIDLRPRSSVWKTGMVLSNCEGTIDENYTGEISAVFYHLNTELPRYKVGDRIGQIKIGTTIPMEFVQVESLSATYRGGKGYGSSGL